MVSSSDTRFGGDDLRLPPGCFYDGDHLFQITTGHARLPRWLADPSVSGQGSVAMEFIVWILEAMVGTRDSRYCVVISRRPATGLHYYRPVHVMVWANARQAEFQARRLRRRWQAGDWADAPILSRAEVKAILRAP